MFKSMITKLVLAIIMIFAITPESFSEPQAQDEVNITIDLPQTLAFTGPVKKSSGRYNQIRYFTWTVNTNNWFDILLYGRCNISNGEVLPFPCYREKAQGPYQNRKAQGPQGPYQNRKAQGPYQNRKAQGPYQKKQTNTSGRAKRWSPANRYERLITSWGIQISGAESTGTGATGWQSKIGRLQPKKILRASTFLNKPLFNSSIPDNKIGTIMPGDDTGTATVQVQVVGLPDISAGKGKGKRNKYTVDMKLVVIPREQ